MINDVLYYKICAILCNIERKLYINNFIYNEWFGIDIAVNFISHQ